MPAVTVIIPFRNRLEWVRQSVESVLIQSFADFELILVDDGSSDTLFLNGGFSDSRIRYVRQDHKGAATARNHGISLARGTFIVFLDSDDLFLPDKLETQVRLMEENPSCMLSHTSYLRMDSNGIEIDTVPSGTYSGRLYPDIIWGCPIATPTVMARSEVFARYRFDEAVTLGEDVLLWIEIARDGEILGIKEPLTKVRIHGENALLDQSKQLEVARFIMARSFAKDRSLGFRTRARGYSLIYRHQAYLCYKSGNLSRSCKYLMLSLLYRPASLSGYLAMAYQRVFDPAAKRSVYD